MIRKFAPRAFLRRGDVLAFPSDCIWHDGVTDVIESDWLPFLEDHEAAPLLY